MTRLVWSTVLICLTVVSAQAKHRDRIILKNGKSIRCTLTNLKADTLYFEERNHKAAALPYSEVDHLFLHKTNVAMIEVAQREAKTADPMEACMAGRMDANNFHRW